MKRIYALSTMLTLLLVLAGCSERLTTEKSQEALNKWMSNYVGSVEVLGMNISPKHLAHVKLKFSNFVHRDDSRGELKDFSGEGTALFVNENASWILKTVWVGNEVVPAENLSAIDNNDASNSDSSDIKVLSQGSYSRVSSPFTIVARDVATYAALREMVDDLPEVGADFFNANTIVAAFLGSQATGGFSIKIRRVGYDQLGSSVKVMTVREIVTQGLTQPSQPYQVVSVPLGADTLSINSFFEHTMYHFPNTGFYEVRSGEFETGNTSEQSEKFRFNGYIYTEQYGKLVTVQFSFTEVNGIEQRKLETLATGIIQPDGKFIIAPIRAGTFIKQPRSLLRVTGVFGGVKDCPFIDGRIDCLALSFESLQPKLTGGFGKGKLEAVQMKAR